MGKGRRPCCDKARVKKGPWSQVEDMKLISFIQNHGHSNWRALPKLAGLARCGKSCRLRWVNYLRPDLKRGNFSLHEEETIIKLHEVMGNKWSKIASYFPGRTDNEIKNVWNTHLKKRIKIEESNNNPYKELAPNDQIKEDCSKQILQQQPSSSSNSCTSNIVEQNVCDKGGNTSNNNKEDLLDELIEIPFEPNLELWDLLEGDSNSNGQHINDNYVQSYEQEYSKVDSVLENNKKDYMESDGSWWWVMYLENELGLNQNESTPLQATSSSNGGLIFKE